MNDLITQKYQAWCVPTRHCVEALKQKPYMICEGDDREDVEMACYLDERDEPAPDKSDYFMWHTECVGTGEGGGDE